MVSGIIFPVIADVATTIVSFAQVIAVIISVVASLPYIIKLYLYYFWTPEIYILYSDVMKVDDGNLSNKKNELQINCTNLSKRVDARIEFHFENRGPVEKEVLEKLEEVGLLENPKMRLGPVKSDKWSEFLLFPGLINDYGVSIEPSSKVTVRLCPTIHLSEFNLPMFYGETELKPIERTISTDSNDNVEESDEEWLLKEFGKSPEEVW